MTTGKAAKLLGVAPRTVAQWMDKGLLAGHRLPNSGRSTSYPGDRRFHMADVQKFARHYDIHLKGVSPLPLAVYLVGSDAKTAHVVASELALDIRFLSVPNYFAAGWQMSREEPDMVLFDFLSGKSDAMAAARKVRDSYLHAAVVAITNEDDTHVAEGVFDKVFFRPFDPTRVVEYIHGVSRHPLTKEKVNAPDVQTPQ
jgi:hypothetical protein